MVARTIGRSQIARSWNSASTASGSVATLASRAHQSKSGRWMSPASSLRARSARTIGRASRAGSRFAEQASWLRTSTFGSIAARRASAAATGGRNPRCIAQAVGPSRAARRGRHGRAYFKAVASSSPPTRFKAQSASRASCPVSSRRAAASAPARSDGSLRSPISRRAVCRVHLLGSASSLTSSGVLRRDRSTGLTAGAGVRGP